MSDTLRMALEAQERKAKEFDQLRGELANFDPATQDARQFYLDTVLNVLDSMTEGETRLIAPLVLLRLGIPQATLIKDVRERKKKLIALDKEKETGKTPASNAVYIKFDDPEPWPTPVTTKDLLDEIVRTIRRFVVLSEHEVVAVALWILHTWTFMTSMICPILGVESPQKRCGKSTLLSILADLCCRALLASNISPASVFRTIEKYGPTLIIDEADTFLRDNEELRGVLNSGHTRATAYVIRVDGDKFEPRIFSTWGPKAISLIGKLPDTLADRSVTVSMRRRRPDESIEKRRLNDAKDLIEIKRKCQRWADDHMNLLGIADPKISAGLNDRAADNWIPLLAIADLAGGEWPEKARRAALALSGVENELETIAVQLLCDFRDLFDEYGDRLSSSFIIEHLCKLEERPWATWNHGKAISPRQIARSLQPFGIIPVTIRTGGETPKGYKKESFADTFARYLPQLSATPPHSSNDAGLRDFSSATPKNDVADKKDGKSSNGASCGVVADKKGGEGLPDDNIPLFDEEALSYDVFSPQAFQITTAGTGGTS